MKSNFERAAEVVSTGKLPEGVSDADLSEIAILAVAMGAKSTPELVRAVEKATPTWEAR